MGHGVRGRTTPTARIDAPTADAVAATMQALATPSRLRILGRLREGPAAVSELAAAAGMEQSAVSHQLQDAPPYVGLVTRRRSGRAVVYALFDKHEQLLLDKAVLSHRAFDA